jgi:RNA polymerase sigma factor (TIGR02999 family)
MSADPGGDVTRLLRAYDPERPESAAELFGAVYGELRRLARALLGRERPGHTLQPTELVHDAFLRLVDQSAVRAADRAHFFGVSARAMRQILVDHARRRRAGKRGGSWLRVTLDEGLGTPGVDLDELLALDEALEALAARDPRSARVVELRVFAGLTIEEIAAALNVSKRTVDGDWAFARLWIARALARR